MPGVTADRDAIEEASLAPLPAPSNQKLTTSHAASADCGHGADFISIFRQAALRS
jgi:hypothetical protein